MYAKSAKDLEVYKLGFELAMEIFFISKRRYIAHFISKLTDCDGENSEIETWLEFAKCCQYITSSEFEELIEKNIRVGQMLGNMMTKAESFCKNN